MESEHLERGIKVRQLLMIALGGTIGTGLFVGTGGNIANAGPLGTLIAYMVGGVIVYSIILSLGELASVYPTTGSFGDYATRFIGPATGYMVFWMYWVGWVITVAVEYIAVGLLMQRWFPHVPVYYFVMGCIVLIFLLNAFSVRVFAEGEFFLASIKVLAVFIFIILGVVGIVYQSYLHGFSHVWDHFYITKANPNLGLEAGFFPKGLSGVFGVILAVIFAYTGTEIVGVAAGEAKNPSVAMPKAIKATLWRIVFFFLGSVIVISVFLPMTDSSIAKSPFVSTLERIPLPFFGTGIPYTADVMNFVIITAILSTANSGVYASSRMVYGLAQKKMFPPIFAKLNKQGTPVYAMYLSMGFTLLGMLTQAYAPEKIIESLINIISFSVIIVWISVSVAQYNFRKQFVASGKSLDDLPYRAPFLPLIQFIGISGSLVGVVGAYMDPDQRIGAYLTIGYTLLCYLGYYLTKDRWGQA
ncbi:amino acid permease [Helicobacter sp. NHP22-001]|uniref:amino acid permease n=1 Tax=Helicobacter sp. NHP22-001 TaxID=3040202 RepID=UPI00244D8F01|nr:amino acid permease [Helicobacter sp. NHP22-001]GMB95731.1 Amino acid permease RocE [Helicobacter sp. NHP22-001]